MIVLKFGGTSVGQVHRIQHVAKIIEKAQKKEGPVCVVVSAMSGETDRLVGLYRQLSDKIQTREYDMLVASGEQASVALVSTALSERGLKGFPLLGYQAGFETDGSRSRARILKIRTERIEELCAQGYVPVVAGFQGADSEGLITTLGRGGSDTSAVALAAALKAKRCDIYTDVSGVFTTDPRICSDAKQIAHMSFEEMFELASLGAKVLHPRSVEIGAKYNIPIRVVNTFDEENPGTMISDEALESPVVTAITYDHNLLLVTLQGVKVKAKFLSELFGKLSQKGVIVDIIVHAAMQNPETPLDLTFSATKEDQPIIEETLKVLHPSFTLETTHSKLSLVGTGMRSHSGVAARVFKVLDEVEVPVTCTTTSEIKISCVVPKTAIETAIRALHKEFGLAQ